MDSTNDSSIFIYIKWISNLRGWQRPRVHLVPPPSFQATRPESPWTSRFPEMQNSEFCEMNQTKSNNDINRTKEILCIYIYTHGYHNEIITNDHKAWEAQPKKTNTNKWSQGDGSKERRSGANSDPPNTRLLHIAWSLDISASSKAKAKISNKSRLKSDGTVTVAKQSISLKISDRPAAAVPTPGYSITHQWTHYVDWNGVTGTEQSSRSWRLIWRSRSLATFAVQLCFADRNADQTTRISTHLRTLSILFFFVWFWKGSWSENEVESLSPYRDSLSIVFTFLEFDIQ